MNATVPNLKRRTRDLLKALAAGALDPSMKPEAAALLPAYQDGPRKPTKVRAPGKSKAQRKAERKERIAQIRADVFSLWEGHCALCDQGPMGAAFNATDLHHLISGSSRRAQESVGTCLPVCRIHHDLLHRNDIETVQLAWDIADRDSRVSVDAWRALDRRLTKISQSAARAASGGRT